MITRGGFAGVSATVSHAPRGRVRPVTGQTAGAAARITTDLPPIHQHRTEMTDEGHADGEEAPTRSHRRSKVGRVIAERELDGLGAELEAYWTGEESDQHSLRELADLFNRRVLRAALRTADQDPLDGEAGNLYELLTGDEVTSGTRIQAEHRLERAGVDVERLKRDFVSHQAVHTYLTKYRGVEAPSSGEGSTVDSARSTVQQLRNRLQAVTETTIGTLLNANELSLGDYHVYVDVRVTCNDCGNQYPVAELFDAGGCDCE